MKLKKGEIMTILQLQKWVIKMTMMIVTGVAILSMIALLVIFTYQMVSIPYTLVFLPGLLLLLFFGITEWWIECFVDKTDWEYRG